MAIFFAVLMVLAVLAWEYFRHRRAKARDSKKSELEPSVTLLIEGFSLPQGLYYHPLHVWARSENEETAVVGIDDLARRLVGKVERVVLPVTGEGIEAGDSGALLRSGDRVASVISPLSGEVVKVNAELGSEPEMISKDPFGKGWLFKIRSSRLAEQLSSMLAGNGARKWMESSVKRMRMVLNGAGSAMAQDGGEPIEDFGSHVDGEQWIRLVREFLGTEAKVNGEP